MTTQQLPIAEMRLGPSTEIVEGGMSLDIYENADSRRALIIAAGGLVLATAVVVGGALTINAAQEGAFSERSSDSPATLTIGDQPIPPRLGFTFELPQPTESAEVVVETPTEPSTPSTSSRAETSAPVEAIRTVSPTPIEIVTPPTETVTIRTETTTTPTETVPPPVDPPVITETPTTTTTEDDPTQMIYDD